MNEGRKDDEGKPRFDLIPPEALFALAELYASGAREYGDRNWEKGMRWGRVFGAIMRHAFRFWAGQRHDEKSGAHHIIAAAWNCIALYCYDTRGVGTDDRPGGGQ